MGKGEGSGGKRGKSGRRHNGEGTIYQRADGRWEGAISVGLGQRKRVYGHSEDTVRRQLTAIRRELDLGLPVQRDGRVRLGDFLADWLERVRPSIKPLTHARYREIVRHVPATGLGRLALTKVTPAQLEHLYADLLARGLSPTTVHQLHSVLHHALGDALRKGIVARNICELVDAPTPRRTQVQALTAAQSLTVMETAATQPADRFEALYVLALTTGMRQGEMLALHWGDVDLEAGVLQVRGTLHRVPGVSVTAKSGLVISDPKTSRSRRPVRLSELAVLALRKHRARQNAERLALGQAWDDRDLVFTNGIGRPVEARNLIRTSYAPLLKRAGVPIVKFHALRHSAATLLLSQGIHPRIVADLLGHSTTSLTMDVYSHVSLDMQHEAAEAMDRLFAALLDSQRPAMDRLTKEADGRSL